MPNSVFFSHSSSVLRFSSQWCQNYIAQFMDCKTADSFYLASSPGFSSKDQSYSPIIFFVEVLFHFPCYAIALIYMFLVQLLFACVFIYVSMFPVETSLFSYELAEARFSRPNSILMSSLNVYFFYFFMLCYFICHAIKYNKYKLCLN